MIQLISTIQLISMIQINTVFTFWRSFYRVNSPNSVCLPNTGYRPLYTRMSNFAAHFRYIVSIRNLVNLPNIQMDIFDPLLNINLSFVFWIIYVISIAFSFYSDFPSSKMEFSDPNKIKNIFLLIRNRKQSSW